MFIRRKLKRIMLKCELPKVHNSFVLSLLEYCAPIFLSLSSENTTKLEKVQPRSHKIVCGSDCSCDQFPLLADRRKNLALRCFVAMEREDHVLHRLFPDHLPSGRRLVVPFCRTSRRISSFIPSCILLYNSL